MGDRVTLALHLLPDLPRALDLLVLDPDATDVFVQALIASRTRRPTVELRLREKR